jgi:hypothetical protein
MPTLPRELPQAMLGPPATRGCAAVAFTFTLSIGHTLHYAFMTTADQPPLALSVHAKERFEEREASSADLDEILREMERGEAWELAVHPIEEFHNFRECISTGIAVPASLSWHSRTRSQSASIRLSARDAASLRRRSSWAGKLSRSGRLSCLSRDRLLYRHSAHSLTPLGRTLLSFGSQMTRLTVKSVGRPCQPHRRGEAAGQYEEIACAAWHRLTRRCT